MAIGSVLVDRARRLSKEAAHERVEGTTRVLPVAGPWFRCRLFLEGAAKRSENERSKAVATPQLMYALRDSEGNLLNITYDEQIEVRSAQLGNAVWKLTGEPQPIRKRRSLIGWLATVERVIEHGFLEVPD